MGDCVHVIKAMVKIARLLAWSSYPNGELNIEDNRTNRYSG
jgi:hypothetical protein